MSRNSAKGSDAGTLVSALLTASRVLVAVSAKSLEDLDDTVTLPQFRALVVLETQGPSRLNQLAALLDVGSPTALRMVDRLVRAGLVERQTNERDRREVVIALSPAGRSLVQRVTRRRRAAIAKVVARMPADRQAELVDALVAFAEAADEPLVDVPQARSDR
jgi:DNA-binding MarR family transcriptional regulator